jgi:hypothetical protein
VSVGGFGQLTKDSPARKGCAFERSSSVSTRNLLCCTKWLTLAFTSEKASAAALLRAWVSWSLAASEMA